ncbi:N-6 DNA methylase [Archangium sp.]|uniref:N-6 DNA methylase n=1 Tax=Archangium sp. TaxID=1872627 RepID=UPI00389B3515
MRSRHVSPGTNELVGVLWKATDVLYANGGFRIDSGVGYVLRLLVLKFLSDVTEGPAISGLQRFVVPPSARWSQLRSYVSSKQGERIDEACAVLEEANPSLRGLLKGAGFNSIGMGARILEVLLQTLSTLPHLSGELVSEGKLGEAADGFLQRLAETSGRESGEFYTPPSVTRLLAELLAPREGMRICHLFCGVGGLLVECTRQVASKSVMNLPHAAASLALYGQERNAETWVRCRMNLLLHGITDAHLELGNVLWSPPLTGQERLLEYDRILANPPWNLDNWGAERASEDSFGRFNPVPPRSNANYAFVQHCLATLTEGGRAALLLPRGVLLRSGGEGLIRRKLLEEDRFEAIIGLPGGVLYGLGLAPVILVLAKGKPTERRNRVLFIDASEAGAKQSRLLRALSQDDIGAIVSAYRDFGGDPRYVRAVPLDEIRKLDWNLTIERYVKREEARERFELDEQLDALVDAESRRDEAARRMDESVRRLMRFLPPSS